MAPGRRHGAIVAGKIARQRATVGFFAPDLSDPRTFSVWRGLADGLRRRDVNLVCYCGGPLKSARGYESQSNVLYDLGRGGRPDAVVLMGPEIARCVDEAEMADFVSRFSGVPLVCVGDAPGGAASVLPDYASAFASVFRRLIGGSPRCANAAFAGNHAGKAYAAFRESAARFGLAESAAPAEPKKPKALRAWLSRARGKGRCAVMAETREMSGRIMDCARAAGLRIPRDLYVCGIEDDSIPARPGTPAAALIVSCRALGSAAADLALRRMAGDTVPETVAVKARLAVSSSRAGAVKAGEETAEVLDGLLDALAEGFDRDTAMKLLGGRLPALGFNAFSVCLFESPGPYRYPQPAPQHARLALCSEARASSAAAFDSRLLLPEKTWRVRKRCLVVEPLYFRGSQLGFLLLDGDAGLIRAARRLAAAVSAALHGASLAAMDKRRLAQLQTTVAVSRATSSLLDPRLLMGHVTALIRERFSVSRVGMYIVDESGERAVLRAGTGANVTGKKAFSVTVGPQTLIGACIEDAKTRISRDPESDAASLFSQDRREIAIPLVSRGEVIGAIGVTGAAGSVFGDEEANVLQSMADQIANAVESARLFQELQRERNLLRTLIDHIPDYIYVKDRSSRFLTANRATASLMGAASPEDLTGTTDFDYYDHPLAEKFREDERNVVEEGKALLNYEEFALDRQGAIHWNLSSKIPLCDETGAVTGLVGVGRDITNIKRTEEALRAQTARLQTALEVARAVTSILDVEKTLPHVVELIRVKFGYYAVEVFAVEDGRAVLRAASGASIPDGRVGTYSLALDAGSIVGHVCSTADAYVCAETDGDPHFRASDFLPETASEAALPLMIGSTVLGCLDVQCREPRAFSPESVTVLKTIAFQIAVAVQNGRLHAAEKVRSRELEEAYRALKENTERGLTTEKMASLGRLTAGIAHEMNTLLAALRASLSEIQGLVTEYKEAIGDPGVTAEDHREIAEEMLKTIQLANTAAERTAGFVRGIKTQTRTIGRIERQLFNAVPVIEEALLLLSHALRKSGCTAGFHPEVTYAQLMGSPGRMAQVVTNLVTNSIDASAETGGGAIDIGLTPAAGGFQLTIADCGAGIREDILPRIFEPLFTTKPIGMGTGLGLTIVHDIVVGEFGGTVNVTSGVGKGTVFTLFFPAPKTE